MKRLMNLSLGMVLLLSAAIVVFAQEEKRDDKKEQKATNQGENKSREPIMSNKEKNVDVMLKIFSAIERRDPQQLLEFLRLDVEFQWPPSLPYGGASRGLKGSRPAWHETWDPLQPTEAERRMDPRVVAASEEEVVILWRQRGVSSTGDRIDTPVLALYQLLEGKLARAQMFYFDTAAVLSFLAKAKGQ
jgi:ketosteroid isomerase-like protein